MTIDDYKSAGEIIQQITNKKSELEQVEHLISNVPGATARVRINSGWSINLPVQALKGQAQARKVQLEQEISDLENQLTNL